MYKVHSITRQIKVFGRESALSAQEGKLVTGARTKNHPASGVWPRSVSCVEFIIQVDGLGNWLNLFACVRIHTRL